MKSRTEGKQRRREIRGHRRKDKKEEALDGWTLRTDHTEKGNKTTENGCCGGKEGE